MAGKRRCIDPNHAPLSLSRSCQLLGLARSNWFYEPLSRTQNERTSNGTQPQHSLVAARDPLNGSRRPPPSNATPETRPPTVQQLGATSDSRTRRRSALRAKNHRFRGSAGAWDCPTNRPARHNSATSRSSSLIRGSPDGKCWRKCHWPGYPPIVLSLCPSL
jgi:hypothetical protein